MKNKQTAVEWLFEQIEDSVNGRCEWEGKWHSLEDTKQKALEMEKQQIIDAWDRGMYIGQIFPQGNIENIYEQHSEQYYSETYNSQQP